MEIDFILDKMRRKAAQLGNHDYTYLYLDWKLWANAIKNVEGAADYFYILGFPAGVRVESKDALYDTALTVSTGNCIEQMHEHQGDLVITNLLASVNSLILIQQIFDPINCDVPNVETAKDININIIQQTNVV